MKAIVYQQYGSPDVIHLAELDKPVPTDDQVLVKVRAASANALDWRPLSSPVLARLVRGGLLRPKDTSVGADVAGTVEAVGGNVKQFRPGDAVFGAGRGSFAEYMCAPESRLAPKPAGVSFEAAAATPVAALTALQGLRKGGIAPGQKVLIYGASGGVGTFAVQIARALGAEVTAVCSTRNLDMARSIGASRVFDYTKEDFTRDGQLYDLILGVNGYRSIRDYRNALSPEGAFVAAGGSLAQIFQVMLLGPMMSKAGGRTLISMGIANVNREDLVFLGELLQAGKIEPVIDRLYPLGEAADAIRLLINEHAQGKLVVSVAHPNG